MSAASIEDWFAINGLFVRYACALDRCDVEAVVDCFAPDASLASPVLGRFEGQDGIRAFATTTADLKRRDGVQFRHVVSNLEVDVDDATAHATCYLLDFRTRGGKTELLSPGVYDCDLRRDGGRWRFVRRDVTMDQPFGERDL
jgi:ketosteroid isomerase-like protein